MGTRGPAPKRASQRRRVNKPVVPVVESETPEVEVPSADPGWHPVAAYWFDSLGRSGQSAFYTSSDWGLAWATAEMLSRELLPKPVGTLGTIVMEAPITGAAMSAFLKACTMLLVTEGDRRRASMELRRPKVSEEVPDVSELASYRQRLQPG